jgi:ankyrin repeat protein
MRNSSYIVVLCALGLGIALAPMMCFAVDPDFESDPWNKGSIFWPRATVAADPLEFPRIGATGNYTPPHFAIERDAELISAATRGDLHIVETLLKIGANPNAHDEWGNCPLLHAASLGAVEMVRTLLDAGADPNVMGMGFTPLGTAALNGHKRVAEMLLEAGARVDQLSKNGLTPLMNAALMNRVSTMEVILHYDTEVDRITPGGRTALSYAAEGGAEQAIELLLARGAEINLRDFKYNTPLFWAAVNDRYGAIRLLLQHGADPTGISLDPF